MFHCIIPYYTLAGLPEVRGNLPVEAAAEGLPGGGDPEAERALPGEDGAQGDPHGAVQPGQPDRCSEARPAGDKASQMPLSDNTRGWKKCWRESISWSNRYFYFFTHLSVVYVCIFSLAVCAHVLMVQTNTLHLSYSEAPQAEIRGEEFVDRVLNQRHG